MTGRLPASLCAIVVLVVAGCGDESSLVEPVNGDMQQAYSCEYVWSPSCEQQDEFPKAPGVFLNFDPSSCNPLISDTNDSDLDGVTDMCEYILAVNFRPLMRSKYYDDTRGEAYWAVRRSDFGYQIFYALAYYWDFGSSGGGCQALTTAWTFFDAFGADKTFFCEGHEGDSEFIVAEVQYNYDTRHWVLDRMFLSAHYGTKASGSRWVPAASFQYPTKTLTYPRVFVAISKHANYESVGACEDIITLWILGGAVPVPVQRDNCSYSTFKEERVYVAQHRNLGSRARPMKDNPFGSQGNTSSCVVSVDRFAGNGRQECFWSLSRRFSGWQPYYGATGYGVQLRDMGF